MVTTFQALDATRGDRAGRGCPVRSSPAKEAKPGEESESSGRHIFKNRKLFYCSAILLCYNATNSTFLNLPITSKFGQRREKQSFCSHLLDYGRFTFYSYKLAKVGGGDNCAILDFSQRHLTGHSWTYLRNFWLWMLKKILQIKFL